MALIKCSECGQEISDKANACLHCGCPIEKAKKRVIIKKIGILALRCSVFIDNLPVGEIGVGTGKNSIEIEIPIGTHYVGVSTVVKHQQDLFSTSGNNIMATSITTSTSQSQDGKQFEITNNDDVVEIEILTKGSWTNSTGRCVIGNIQKYTKSEYIVQTLNRKENTEIEKQKIKRYLPICICGIIFLFLAFYLGFCVINPSDFTVFIMFLSWIIGIGCCIYYVIKMCFKS